MSRHQWLLLIVLSLLWGGSFFFVAIAVRDLPPVTIVMARVACAAAILLAVAASLGHALPRTLTEWRSYAVMGLLSNALPFTLIVTGQTEISSGLASVLNATTPVWSLLLAHVLTDDEKLTAGRLAGALTGILGVAILVGPDAMSGTGSVGGMLCGLGAAFTYGLAAHWGRRFKTVPPVLSSACQLSMGAVMLLPVWIAVDRPWTLAPPSRDAAAAILALAVLSTALAYNIFYRVMAEAGPQNAMLVSLLVPVSAITLGVAFLGETMHARHAAGALVIALSLAIIDGRLMRAVRRAA